MKLHKQTRNLNIITSHLINAEGFVYCFPSPVSPFPDNTLTCYAIKVKIMSDMTPFEAV